MLKKLIEQIDRSGRTDQPVYYGDDEKSWDYRTFNLEHEEEC